MARKLLVPGRDVTSGPRRRAPETDAADQDTRLEALGLEVTIEQIVEVGRSRAGEALVEIDPGPPRAGPAGAAPSLRGTSAGAAPPAPDERTGGPDTQAHGDDTQVICEVEFDSGARMWLYPETLYELFGRRAERGGPVDPGQQWLIDPIVPADDAARGAVRDTLSTVTKWAVRVAKGVATGAVRKRPVVELATALEEGLHEGRAPGLYSLSLDPAASDGARSKAGAPGLRQCSGPPPGSGRPMLLFLHGTLSSTMGSFGKLWEPGNLEGRRLREDFVAQYGDTAYALEHHTLAASPVDNARALVRGLPEGAELHLVSHSRGGLIGELLCLSSVQDKARFTPAFLARLLEGDPDDPPVVGVPEAVRRAWAGQADELADFVAELYAKKLRVTRFVRVACPSEGTTLAMRRLDVWLSLYRQLIEKAAQGAVAAALEHFVPAAIPLKLMLALIAAHRRDDTKSDDALPGLWSMMPGNPFISLVNLQALTVDADLTVIAGDTQRKARFGGALEFALNRFFRDENDFVVNTGAMFGGLPRKAGARYRLDSGDDVDHFSYFRNAASVRWLGAGLLRSDGDDGGFLPIGAAPRKPPHLRAAIRPRAVGPKPVAYLLPGIMGSELALRKDGTEEPLWLDLKRISCGRFSGLAINAAGIVATRPFDEYYGDLVDFLGETHEVRPFAYDWRLGPVESGHRLAADLSALLDDLERRAPGMPVRIVAHSMGGLVVRAMIASHPDVWKRTIANDHARVLMLGTPNGGSFEIVRLLLAQSGLLHRLALLDLTRGPRGLLGVVARFPGVLQMLPNDTDEFFLPEAWQRLRAVDDVGRPLWEPPGGEALMEALQQVRQWRAVELDPRRFVYVAGCADRTPARWIEDAQWDEPSTTRHRSIAFESSPEGDGRVLWRTGIPPQVRCWFMHGVQHGDLCSAPEHFDALLELLQTGDTEKLPRKPPTQRAASSAQLAPIRRDAVDQHPSREDVLASLMGRGERRPAAPPLHEKAQVSVVHGNLAYARYPVMVGHYAGDTIVGAEDHLDRSLHGLLRRRAALGLYAGAQGTDTIVLQKTPRTFPAGAVVVGLGRPDTLNPGALREGVARAALELALAVLEAGNDRDEGERRSAGLSCLLLGSGAGGMSLRNSIAAILGGIGAANRRLAEQKLADRVWIDKVEFLELWLDKATQAANALELVLRDGELADMFAIDCAAPLVLREGPGGLRRIDVDEAPNWWNRMEISYAENLHALRFVAITDRARAEVMQVAGQLRTAEQFIEQAISRTSRDADISRTLFEMLVPNRVKELTPEQHDVWLLLDERSAAYPWELLEDRWTRDGKPLAVAAGMLRQFKTIEFRDRPTAAMTDAALVIGDPELPVPVRPDFPFAPLDGARTEGRDIAALLQRYRFEVTARIGAGSRQILSALHGAGYRILHVASHGVHEWELAEMRPPPDYPFGRPERQVRKVSGMVIGDGVFLTPGDVEQMRIVPELVFLNCCHLGQVGGDPNAPWRLANKLAANLAAQFIRMGVRAVIAAGWSVGDAAALTFATVFYEHLLAGDNFGRAVRHARESTYLQHGATNTWGAYQCYGDPEWRLRVRADQDESPRTVPFRSAAQAVTEVENISSRIIVGAADAQRALDETLDLLRKRHPDWLERADLAAAVGIALGELERFDEAIAFLKVAIEANKALVSLRAVEQRANFTVKAALRSALGPPHAPAGGIEADRESARKRIEAAIADLDALCRLGETVERRSLLGSAWKRLAWIVADDDRQDPAHALKESARAYRKANELANRRRDDDPRPVVEDPYPLANWLTLLAVARWFDPQYEPAEYEGSRVDVQTLTAEGIRCSEQANFARPDFWSGVGAADCHLVTVLQDAAADSDARLREKMESIVAGYAAARARGASTKEIGSVREQLRFLVDMARRAGKPALAARLAQIRDSFA